MSRKPIRFALLAALTMSSSPLHAGDLTPPGIPVRVDGQQTAIDPELSKLILIGIKAAGNTTTDPHPARPEGGGRVFQGDLLILPSGQVNQHLGVYNPIHETFARPGLDGPDFSYLNRFRAYFSSASGGFGLRIGYDRRIRPELRLTAGTELLTYGYRRASEILGAQLPDNVTRITLMSIPFGLQQQFGARNRVVPHLGIAVGPLLRFDHHPNLAPGFYPTGIDIRTGARTNSLDLTLRPYEDFPTMSLSFGGFVEAGADIRLGSERDLSLTVAGRYSVARFSDTLGEPGDFSGPSVSVGFGKYF